MLELVKQNHVYPYEYMNSFKIFFDDKLPDRHDFFSPLKGECISEKNYLYAIDVWIMFRMKTMGDYHGLSLLLPDVFENFICVCLKYYGLGPCHYFSSLGLSWDAMLKMTVVELELISDIEMYLFIKKGVSQVNTLYTWTRIICMVEQ